MNTKANGDSYTSLVATDRLPMDALLTLVELAALLKVPNSWVSERTRQRSIGRIPGFKLGKYWRFRLVEVLAWLDQQRSGTKV